MNQATTLGGAIFNLGTANVTNSTFSGNQGSGGSIWNQGTNSSITTLTNSVFAGATSGECVNASGSITNGGYNISDDATCGFGTGYWRQRRDHRR